ncbi:hypothetical protein GCM10010149_25620 [Nonomuraea roseoviolacea subsp. roseoviolacea]|uniref:Uncharacterized protein n=1 Tax=Nonomuraea roseoviolacea subsp. carminata TaxID=160689 RepID=A0ABT1JRI8_9ACTN|nr:hypothetical protein [Nonomuraea roseoviolacea]MCP2344345.1 hypothetical protein [Nonomuraea roseoviolacea subsp. carminata]
MPVSSAVRDRCRTLLGQQEQILYVFPALSIGPPGAANFLIVVTDKAISVLATRMLRTDRPVSVHAAFPRHTRLGPIMQAPRPVIELGSMAFEVDEEYAAVVAAADAEVFAPETLPLDPLPYL